MRFDLELDARGLLCPLPVLKAQKHLRGLSSGQILRLQSDDPAAVIDVPHYCGESGHILDRVDTEGETNTFYIRHK